MFRIFEATEFPAKRRFAVMASICAAVFAIVVPISAITYGELDGNRHPAVLLLLMDVAGAPDHRKNVAESKRVTVCALPWPGNQSPPTPSHPPQPEC